MHAHTSISIHLFIYTCTYIYMYIYNKNDENRTQTINKQGRVRKHNELVRHRGPKPKENHTISYGKQILSKKIIQSFVQDLAHKATHNALAQRLRTKRNTHAHKAHKACARSLCTSQRTSQCAKRHAQACAQSRPLCTQRIFFHKI